MADLPASGQPDLQGFSRCVDEAQLIPVVGGFGSHQDCVCGQLGFCQRESGYKRKKLMAFLTVSGLDVKLRENLRASKLLPKGGQ